MTSNNQTEVRRQYIETIILLCLGILLSYLLFIAEQKRELKKIQNDFNIESLNRINSFKRELDLHLEILRSLHALYQSSEFVTREEFQKFVKPALLKHKDIQALEWVPRVLEGRRGDYEQAAQADGYSSFRITELDEKKGLVPARKRNEYFPVYYLEPHEGNESVMGFDMASDATRLEALSRARDYGSIAATGRIKLIQEAGEQSGLLVVLPVYHVQTTLNSVEGRHENLAGFVVGEYRIGYLFESSMSYLTKEGIDIDLIDETSSPGERVFYTHLSRLRSAEERKTPEEKSEDDHILQFRQRVSVADRQWSVMCKSIPEFIKKRETWQPWSFLYGGLLISGLLFAYLVINLRRTYQVQKLADDLSAEVVERKRAEEKREQVVQELQDALSKVKTLSGLLPICSACKKIRDDKGYWNKIEGYIRDRSEAEFTHSICPDCAQELYPELFEKK